ncbi:spermidine synthase [Paenibacillus allorhizosphaerae]|uniref:Polyamine aminopropyltransferase n=1 Tax=Paenibacillus allorhizosphaerae TaxID=2849866 RepID=A0ABN7TG67_9BACL|nr:fused MFS/spermidine synthase [Paenibacillus allorhizosphaerae]CAG7616421.1 Polyamine aminopropyltransferase [Paenibacillus allorhizosphaerae]
MQLLAKEISSYNEISVYETTELYGEMGKFRFLQFADGAVQGALDIKHPDRIVLEYPRAIIHLLEKNNPSLENVFVIGHGTGTIAGHFPDKRFTVAEIDAQVVELSRRFFNYSQNNVVTGDGRQLLEKEAPNTFDFIILDAFSAKGTPMHLVTIDFFTMAKEKLNARGAVVMNLMGKSRNDKLINAIHTTLKAVFAETKAFSPESAGASDLRNIILIGSDRAIDLEIKQMAGFIEIGLEQGHTIVDRDNGLHG